MMRKGWLVAAFSAALSITSNTAHAGGHVYALRGLINVFSYGMDEMVAKCKRRGIPASAHGHAEYHSLAAQAAALVKSGKGPIIIVGHSYGADAAVFMARGDDVSSALRWHCSCCTARRIDPLGIPSNVRSVVNYYQTNNPAWRAKAVHGPGFRGSINNINLDKATDVTHFNIEKVGRLQDQAMSRIAALTGTGRAIATAWRRPSTSEPAANAAPARASSRRTAPRAGEACRGIGRRSHARAGHRRAAAIPRFVLRRLAPAAQACTDRSLMVGFRPLSGLAGSQA